MAKQFVKFTLAAKVRLLFGAAFILIIGAALVAPWLYMKAMVNEEARRAGDEVTRLYLNEWRLTHAKGQMPTTVPSLFLDDDASGVRSGPTLLLGAETGKLPPSADRAAREALRTFLRDPAEQLVQKIDYDEQGRRIYSSFRVVRAEPSCVECHRSQPTPKRPLQPLDVVGVIRADLPGEQGLGGQTMILLVVIGAGVLALLLATLTFYFIVTRLILSPVRQLKDAADRVADGDLSVRTELSTGDEFEQLGRSFDEMLEAIARTQNQLRAANRALDLKLNELTESNVALFESNRLKSEFLGNVSHELRTPLNSIIGFAELLGESGDEKCRRYSANILTSARMLLGIINDLLDLARIEAGRVQLTVTGISVADICETLIGLVTPLANKKNLSLRLDAGDDLPIVQTDAGKVQQILYNLLSNAVKFTPAEGRVVVSARRGEAPDTVAISVADTGPGISEADQARIFEKFQQLDSSVTREHGGAGLGLAIAKDLAAALGGQLTLKSQPGRGATFTLILPVEMTTG